MNPWVATIITVVLGVGLGLTGYQLVWPLFGAANQLLAALGLLAVCAWLGNAGRNNKMFYVPHGVHAHGDADLVGGAQREGVGGPENANLGFEDLNI